MFDKILIHKYSRPTVELKLGQQPEGSFMCLKRLRSDSNLMNQTVP